MKFKAFKQRFSTAAEAASTKQVAELSETLQLIDTHKRCSVKLMVNDAAIAAKLARKRFGQQSHRLLMFNQSLKYPKKQLNINNRRSTCRLKSNSKLAFSGCLNLFSFF